MSISNTKKLVLVIFSTLLLSMSCATAAPQKEVIRDNYGRIIGTKPQIQMVLQPLEIRTDVL